MTIQKTRILVACAAIGLSSIAPLQAQTTDADALTRAIPALANLQATLKLPVRVIAPDGKPVANAKVTPWALNSSQGHGWWNKGDDRAGFGPQAVVTNDDGIAEINYPRFRDAKEQIQTNGVSLRIDHPEFAYIGAEYIDVPLETKKPYEIKLAVGVPLEIRPLLNEEPAELDNLFVRWSDGRSFRAGVAPEKLANGTLRIPAMPLGKNSVLLAKLDGDRVTHFSKIIDFELKAGEAKPIDVSLRPSLRLEGSLSNNVPRPVRQGRVKLQTLDPADAEQNRVEWLTWVPIQSDGTFVIEGWPAGERIQLIALCEGYIATSGAAPDVVKNPRDPKTDPFNHPQVFDPDQRIEVAMTPLVPCIATAVDEDEKPIAGVTVNSWPNVGWWNGGSQIYCAWPVRGERLLRERDFDDVLDKTVPMPFEAKTNAEGKLTLQLPVGSQVLDVTSDVYELPVFLGRRDLKIEIVRDKPTEVTLRLQPRGTEKLGEWDKLAGVVFGCSTREGRRICALPGVRKQMDEFATRFQEAKNQRDPQLLSEAYAAVADAFANVGDKDESAKWRQKSADQAAKAKISSPAQP